MQAIGWISILIGLLHFKKMSGIFLFIIGIAVVYVVRENNKNDLKLAHRVFQAQIKITRRFKKAPKVASEQIKPDFLIRDLPKLPNLKSKGKNIEKSDWFIYRN